MSETIEFQDTDYAEFFRIEKIAAAGGGEVADPYPIWADLLAQAPVHAGSLGDPAGRGFRLLAGPSLQPVGSFRRPCEWLVAGCDGGCLVGIQRDAVLAGAICTATALCRSGGPRTG